MPSYFKRYYLDDVKLAQRALLEFHRSLCSGRMIAFTGSMTTESCGYGSWEDLVDAYARVASQVKEERFDCAGVIVSRRASLKAGRYLGGFTGE